MKSLKQIIDKLNYRWLKGKQEDIYPPKLKRALKWEFEYLGEGTPEYKTNQMLSGMTKCIEGVVCHFRNFNFKITSSMVYGEPKDYALIYSWLVNQYLGTEWANDEDFKSSILNSTDDTLVRVIRNSVKTKLGLSRRQIIGKFLTDFFDFSNATKIKVQDTPMPKPTIF